MIFDKNSDIGQLLADDGIFAQQITDYLPRPGQQKMAELISGAIQQGKCHVIEAPSGLGKTWAYLIPVILSGKKTLISTAGHYLQQQLYQRDIPLVLKLLSKRRSVVLLKGRSNYLCPYYLKRHIQAQGKSAVAIARQQRLSHLYQQFRTTEQGDLGLLGVDEASQADASCTAEECLSLKCPDYKICPFMKLKRQAEHADIVIVNHSLLLSIESLVDNSLLKDSRTVIVDEAHRLMDFAQQISGYRLSSRQLRQHLRQLLAACLLYSPEDADIQRYVSQLLPWLTAVAKKIPESSPYHYQGHQSFINKFIEIFEHLQAWLNLAKERDYQLSLLATLNQQLLLSLHAILKADGLCWVHKQGRGFIIQNTPIHLLKHLQKMLARHPKHSWIFTSATLSTCAIDNPQEKKAEFFLRHLGLSDKDFYCLTSPYDNQQQARLFLPQMQNTPDQAGFYQEFAQRLKALINVCPGRVLVLFSSYQALDSVGSLLSLDGQRNLLQQNDKTKGKQDNFALVKEFIRSPKAVLLATGAFWEGVDLSGAPIDAVVMDKLPFRSPTDPLAKLRSDYLEQHGIDCFNEFLLPEAVIRFRQGCGRLLRRESDKGVIMLADSRVSSKVYGQCFLNSLVAMPICRSLDQIKSFLN